MEVTPDLQTLSTNNIHGPAEFCSVVSQISVCCQARPKALALLSSDTHLTYADLERQSNQLAHHLRSLGVGPEVLVGVCLDRGPEMVVAALAVLKAGGAYAPLDPEHPAERLKFMLQDAGMRVLISCGKIVDRLGPSRCTTVDFYVSRDRLADLPGTAPDVEILNDHLAYVIYTSGTTGRPKGVQITHANLGNLIAWHNRAFAVSAADRASQLANVAFDAAVWETWPNLVAGSSIYFPDEATRVSAEPLRDWLIQEKISISFVPTPLAEALLTLKWPQDTALRFLLTGGDALRHHPPADLPFVVVNNYGPTECTVVATSGIVSDNPHASALPSIGRPIDNLQVLILDEKLRKVPAGTAGELHIGGASVGRGYLNRPEQNAARFIPNPFSHSTTDRLYKTGDLALYLPNGEISFAGRVDEQIKIRGYRIEPDEIAAVLDQHAGVEASVVVARGEEDDKRLVAYIAADESTEFTHSELTNFLKQYLPDYMVPALFVRVGALPTTSSGKFDRQALPVPRPENTIGEQTHTGPRNPVEGRIVAILSELLGIERISVHDNFFYLGGHSLLGTQLIARARDAFGVELPLRTVFDSPTAAELSSVIETLQQQKLPAS